MTPPLTGLKCRDGSQARFANSVVPFKRNDTRTVYKMLMDLREFHLPADKKCPTGIADFNGISGVEIGTITELPPFTLRE